MDNPASAIVNAIRAAIGVRLDAIPATPERIFARLDETRTDAASPLVAAG